MGVGFFVSLSYFYSRLEYFDAVPGTPSYRVAMSSEMEYHSDKQAFEITDTMVLSEQAAARAICEGQPPGLGEHSRPDTATMDRTGLDLCVREAVEGAGWTYAADDTGRPTFTRSRLSSVEVPWWPLSVTHSVDAPSVLLSHLLLVADDGSTATIVAPKRFIRASSPPASSTEFLLDAAGSEAVKVPIGVDQTFDSAVRLELVSPAARNPVVAPLLDFSWWGSAKWIVLAIAAIFQEKVREVLRRCLGAVARHAGWRKKPDAEPVQTPGRPEKASPTGKADAAAPGGSPATATGPADEA